MGTRPFLVKLGSSLYARRRPDFFLITRVVTSSIPLTIGSPLATFATTCLAFQSLLLLPVGHRIHFNNGLKESREDRVSRRNTDSCTSEFRLQAKTQNQTCSGARDWSNGGTLLAPLGLSLFLVMLDSHFSSVSSSTSSG